MSLTWLIHALHGILWSREIYPPNTFTKCLWESKIIHMSKSELLSKYIHKHVEQIWQWIKRSSSSNTEYDVARVLFALKNEGIILEIFIFEFSKTINLQTPNNHLFFDTISESRPLPHGTTFEILVDVKNMPCNLYIQNWDLPIVNDSKYPSAISTHSSSGSSSWSSPWTVEPLCERVKISEQIDMEALLYRNVVFNEQVY